MSDYLVVMVTAKNEVEARAIAKVLLEKRLAACVNFLPITSMYHWEGAIQDEGEVLMLIKTTSVLFKEKLEAAVKENHSYSVPEIIGLPIVIGSADYLKWIMNETST